MIAQAERVDGKGLVEGDLQINRVTDKYYILLLKNGTFIPIEILPETLKFKVGDNWYSEAEIEEAVSNQKDLIIFSRWLMGYVMELHEFRNGIFKINKDTQNLEMVMDYVIMRFPILQGTAQQRMFKELGIDTKGNQDHFKRAIKVIKHFSKD